LAEMALKNSSYGVFNQRFQCFNCGRNSVSLGFQDQELIERDEVEYDSRIKAPSCLNEDQMENDMENWIATCKKCGWVDV
jgi:transcription elongation factor Elf1